MPRYVEFLDGLVAVTCQILQSKCQLMEKQKKVSGTISDGGMALGMTISKRGEVTLPLFRSAISIVWKSVPDLKTHA